MEADRGPYEKGYPTDIKDILVNWDLQWFADNPCAPPEEIRSQIKYGLDKKGLQKFLNEKKEKIENEVTSYTLDERPIHLDLANNDPELRCVLLGRVGEGKSSLGNLLVGKGRFKVYRGAASGTRTIDHAASDEYNIRVIDTPGLVDAEEEDVDTESAKVFTFFSEGIHAFIVVMDLANPRITEQDLQTFDELKKTFGDEILQHTFIVFTKAETYFKTSSHSLREYLNDIEKDQVDKTILRDLLNVIGNKIIAVENECQGYKRCLSRQSVLDLIRNCGQGCYTIDCFKEDQQDNEEEADDNPDEEDEEEISPEEEAKKDATDGLFDYDGERTPRGKRKRKARTSREEEARNERDKEIKKAIEGVEQTREVARCAQIHVATFLATKTRKELIKCKVQDECRLQLVSQINREVRRDARQRAVRALPTEEVDRIIKDVVETTVDRITDPTFLERCKIILKSIFTLNKPFKIVMSRETIRPRY